MRYESVTSLLCTSLYPWYRTMSEKSRLYSPTKKDDFYCRATPGRGRELPLALTSLFLSALVLPSPSLLPGTLLGPLLSREAYPLSHGLLEASVTADNGLGFDLMILMSFRRPKAVSERGWRAGTRRSPSLFSFMLSLCQLRASLLSFVPPQGITLENKAIAIDTRQHSASEHKNPERGVRVHLRNKHTSIYKRLRIFALIMFWLGRCN